MPGATPAGLSGAKRVLVYGVTGSGKTVLAKRIAERTGLPWHIVDDLTFEADWQQVSTEEQRRRVAEICAGERWVLDSAYGAWLDIPLSRVELVVGLDYPRWLSLGRLLRRTTMRILDRKPICNGNVETLRLTLSRESILAWHFRSFARKRMRIRSWEQAADGPPVLRFASPAQTQAWLDGLA